MVAKTVFISKRVAFEQRTFVNPWETMSNTTDGTATNLRRNFAASYGIRDISMCMLTGLRTHPGNLKLAHILPRSTKAHILRSLGMRPSEVNDHRNLLVLSTAVEEAFDAMLISFVPFVDGALVRRYVMKVWDESILSEPVHEGAKTTVATYVGVPLTLTVNGRAHTPFRRCLSYQAFQAFWKWNSEGNPSLRVPDDFDDSSHEGSWAEDRSEFLKQLLRDKAEEEDDGDGNWDEAGEDNILGGGGAKGDASGRRKGNRRPRRRGNRGGVGRGKRGSTSASASVSAAGGSIYSGASGAV